MLSMEGFRAPRSSPTRTITVTGSFEKFCHRNVQCAGKFLDALNRRIARSAFDVRDVSPMQAGTRREFSLGNPKNESLAPDCRTQATLQTRFSPVVGFHALVISTRSPFTSLLRFLSRKVLGNLLFRENPGTVRNRRLRETRLRMRALPEYCGQDD